MSLKYKKGNLILLAEQGEFDVIAHGTNCFKVMGAGIALQLKLRFPKVYQADLMSKHGHKEKLGTITVADNVIPGLTVINCYTQFHYGYVGGVCPVDYDAIRSCMRIIKHVYHGNRIGLPMIGCGLAGGEPSIVLQIIEDELGDENVTIVTLN